MIHFIEDTSGLPRVDYRLSIGENPRFEKIVPENAYDLPYVRLVYREMRGGPSGLYELWSVKLIKG